MLKERKCRGPANVLDQFWLSSFYSCLQEIRLNTIAYISLVIAFRLKILIFDSLYFVIERIYTTHIVISSILQRALYVRSKLEWVSRILIVRGLCSFCGNYINSNCLSHYYVPKVKPKFLNWETIIVFVLSALRNKLFCLCHLIIFIKRGSQKIEHIQTSFVLML